MVIVALGAAVVGFVGQRELGKFREGLAADAGLVEALQNALDNDKRRRGGPVELVS